MPFSDLLESNGSSEPSMEATLQLFVEAAQEWVTTIQAYESDTFSAEGSAVTEEEAIRMLTKYLQSKVDTVDGVLFDDLLEVVREEMGTKPQDSEDDQE